MHCHSTPLILVIYTALVLKPFGDILMRLLKGTVTPNKNISSHYKNYVFSSPSPLKKLSANAWEFAQKVCGSAVCPNYS